MILLILGFGIRLAYGAARYRGELMHLSGTNFIRSWEHDGLEHVLIAKALLDGRGYVVESIPLPPGKKVRFPDQDAMFKAPMYEFFLAGVFAISGFSFKLFFPLQALFGGLASGLLGLIAWETFKRPWAAWIAGFFAATHPILVNAATVPYNEDLFFFLFLGALWAFLLWFRARDLKWALLCGLFVGLCTLTRESGIPLLAAMGAVGILSAIRDAKAWLGCATIALIAFVVIAPWTLRNYLRFHTLIPVASIVGEDLAEGNNECISGESLWTSYYAEGSCAPLSRRIAQQRALTPLPNLPASVQFDHLSKIVAISFIKENPATYVKLALRRFWTCLLPYVPRGNQKQSERLILSLYWLAIYPAGVVGLILCLRRPGPRVILLTLVIGLSYLSIMAVLYWSDLRFRVGIDLLLGCFAAWAYARLLDGKQLVVESESSAFV